MLFVTVVSQSIMHMHVAYNTACFVLYTMHAAFFRGRVDAAAARATVWLDRARVGLIIPAYSVGFTIVLLVYTQGQLMQPCRWPGATFSCKTFVNTVA